MVRLYISTITVAPAIFTLFILFSQGSVMLNRLRTARDETGAGFANIVITLALIALLTVGGFYGYQSFFAEASDEEVQKQVTQYTDDARDMAELKERNPLEGFDVESELP